MTRKIVLTMVALVLALSAGFAQSDGGKSDLEIRAVDRELEAAVSKGDSVKLDRLLADDYIEIDAQGGLKRKSDVLAVARSMGSGRAGVSIGPDKSVDDLIIRVHGDSALVVGRTTIRYQFMENQTVGTPPSSQNPVAVDQERFIRTYAKVGGIWQLVARQTTSIAKR